MCTTSNCCLCFSLRTGTLIIGWLTLLVSVFIVCSLYVLSDQALFAGGILQPILAIALLYGVYKPYKAAVFWYWWFEAAVVVLQITYFILFFVVVGADGHVFSVLIGPILLICLFWLIKVYCIVVVYNYYKEIDSYV